MTDPIWDFSGYGTKNDIKCSDGRIIRKDAFKDNDKMTVPLVWDHDHSSPDNILGHALLENREDGVFVYGKFNESDNGKKAKLLVVNKDIESLSIYANQLQQKGFDVLHGAIREVSLVLSGANPGAKIQNVFIAHSDEVDDETAIITFGEHISLPGDEKKEDELEHADGETSENEKTVQDVIDGMSEEQRTVFYAVIGAVVKSNGGEENPEEIEHSDKGDTEVIMKKNIFENDDNTIKSRPVLTRVQLNELFADAQKMGSLKDSFLAHAGTYGIDNIDLLFPDATNVTNPPEFIQRENAWVSTIISGTHHVPFSRIKSMSADITGDAARALGYPTMGGLKKEEVFALAERETTPTTFYKKQKLDRDDIIDITTLDVVAWLKAEMRGQVDEELARAILISDGRAVDSEDKIKEDKIRPIYKDADFYSHKVQFAAATTPTQFIDGIVEARVNYKRPGNPVMFTTTAFLNTMLLLRDLDGRRLYRTVEELASELRVSRIVEVPVMEGVSRLVEADTYNLRAILVNPYDYTVGADKGGQLSMFDDFDIDYNQYKYLMEARCSGALTHYKSALVIEQKAA